MEVAGIVAAGVGLVPVVVQTARSLRKAAKSIKLARRELEDLTNEMTIFTSIYHQFLMICSKRMKTDKRALSALNLLISWAKKAKLDFQKLSQHVDALTTHPMQPHSTTENITAHVKWYLQKSTLEYLRASLIVARQSMVGFSNLCNIERLDEELAMLKSILTPQQRLQIKEKFGMPVEELIQSLQDEKDERYMDAELGMEVLQESMMKVSLKQSQNQDFDFTRNTEQLLRFSNSIGRYVERALPSNETSRTHSRSSKSPSRRPRLHTPSSQSSGTMYTQCSQSSRRRPAAAFESPPTSPEPLSRASSHQEIPSSSSISTRGYGSTNIYPKVHGATIPDPVQRTPPESNPVAAYRPTTQYLDLEEKYSGLSPPISDYRIPDLPPSSSTEPRESTERLANTTNAHESGQDITILNDADRDEVNLAARVEDAEEVIDEEGVMGEREATDEEDEEDEDEDEVVQQVQQTETRPSKWQPLTAFEGREPRNLRERRERSSSPQEHWASKPWEEKKK